MKRAPFALPAVVMALAFGVAVHESHAQLKQVEVRVDGLACPFCAYGLEKNLKALNGVESVKIGLKEGVATLVVQEGETLSLDRLRDAVKDAGFTPRETRLTAAGRVTTLEALAHDEDAMQMVAGIQEEAEAQGIELPTRPIALVMGEPLQVFLLLRGKDEASRQSFDELAPAPAGDHSVTITGTIPEMNDGGKKMPATLFVENVQPGNAG